jgi:hypothetical protein
MSKKLLLIMPLILSGCSTIYDWADGVGKHMPTIGEPCRHWQCITESGQRKSEDTKWLEEVSQKPPVPKKSPQSETAPEPPATQ